MKSSVGWNMAGSTLLGQGPLYGRDACTRPPCELEAHACACAALATHRHSRFMSLHHRHNWNYVYNTST